MANGGCNARNKDHTMWRTNCVKTCGYCGDPRYNPNKAVPPLPTGCTLEVLANEAVMTKAGWSFSHFHGKMNQIGHGKCTAGSWHGYRNGNGVATLSKVLRSSGKATLDYGNCWNAGKTNVYLNGKKIDSASPLTGSKTVVFACKAGDKLELKDEEGNAVIQMSKLTVCGSGACSSLPLSFFVHAPACNNHV